MADAIVLHNVTKTFGSKVAVSELDLVVPNGALYGVIGPNGAGKTTSIRIILSILFPDRGDVHVLGHKSALEAKDRIGYLPEERGLYRKMKVGDFLTYMAHLKGLGGAGLPARINRWLERVGLGGTAQKRCDELSKGMQQKVQFIASVIHEPALVILDEPFSGLDPVSSRQLRELVLEEHARGATVIFSTHVMEHAEQLCEHIVMIHGGRKVLDSSIRQIRHSQAVRGLWFEPLDPNAAVDDLRQVPGVTRVERNGGAWEVSLATGVDPPTALRAVAAAVPCARVELRRPSLEDVFVSIVSGSTDGGSQDAAQLRDQLRAGSAGEVRT